MIEIFLYNSIEIIKYFIIFSFRFYSRENFIKIRDNGLELEYV